MDLTVRPVLPGDFARCAELLKGHLAYPAATIVTLPRVWRRWLDDEVVVSALLEDQAAGGGPALVGFAMSVFVSDAWREQALCASAPYLSALTRSAAGARPGDPMAAVFANTPARFRLTRSQKKLLREALRGSTDAALAAELSIAAATVKSHWRSIYNHVAGIAPELLPSNSREAGSAPIRGQEKRRRLLEYLRRHPEELCPGINEARTG